MSKSIKFDKILGKFRTRDEAINIIVSGSTSSITFVESLDDLNDTEILFLEENQYLRYNGVNWANSGINFYNLSITSHTHEYVPLTGGVIDGHLTVTTLSSQTIYNVDEMVFNTGSTLQPSAGTLFYDENTNSLSYKPYTINNDVILNIGQENIIKIYNNTGSQINNGQVCTINGSHISGTTVTLTNSSIATSFISGVATHDIPSGACGFITNFGIVHNLDTSTFDVGAEIYSSDILDGGYSILDNLMRTSKANRIGRVLKKDSTNGEILVNISNESRLSFISQRKYNDLTINNASSGIISFSGFSINSDNTKFDVGYLSGWLADNSIMPPTLTFIDFSGVTGLTPTYLLTHPVTYVGIDKNYNIIQQSSPFTNSQTRDYIDLGVIVHSNNININTINNQPVVEIDTNLQLYDLMRGLGFFNVSGNIFTNTNSGLTIDKTSGYIFKQGSNFETDIKNPHNKYLPPLSAITFNYRLQDSTEYSGLTNIDPNNYDLNGVLTPVPNKNYTIQRIAIFSSNFVRIQYGQNYYKSLSEAVSAIETEDFVVEPNIEGNGLIRCFLIVKESATDLSITTDVRFIPATKFGTAFGSGSISVTDLQRAYNNSLTPEIITNSLGGGVDFQIGSGSDDDDLLVFKQTDTTVNGYIKGTGYAYFNTLSARTYYTNVYKKISFCANDMLGNIGTYNNIFCSAATSSVLSNLYAVKTYSDNIPMSSIYTFVIPNDYKNNTDINVELSVCSVNSGQSVIGVGINNINSGVSYTGLSNIQYVEHNFISVINNNYNQYVLNYTFSGTTIKVNDDIGLVVYRNTLSGDDTIVSNVYLSSVKIKYISNILGENVV